MIFLLVLCFAAALTGLMTPLAARVGHRLGLVDRPGGRRQHQGVIPRTGGLALFAGFFSTLLLVLLLPLLAPTWSAWLPASADPKEQQRLLALLAGSLFCVIMGFVDDRHELGTGPQYAVQAIASLIAMAGLIFLKHINNPFGAGFLFDAVNGFPWWIIWPLTTFWFMGMMNTVNWLDGLSGLVTGVTAIMSLVLALHMLFVADPPQTSVALLPVALLGATLGFLPFNFAPARLFMGSSGSYFLGFAVAALGIIGGARVATVMLVLGLPALDVAWLVLNRWRRGVSPGQGGRDHLHFRLLDLGLSERTIVLGYWGFSAAFGVITLLLDGQWQKISALLVLGGLALVLLVWASGGEGRTARGG